MTRDRKTAALLKAAQDNDDALRASLHRMTGRMTGKVDLLGLATGPIGQTAIAAAASRALRSYPLATIAVGAGLAWLIYGARPTDDANDGGWRDLANKARNAAQDRLTALHDKMVEGGNEAMDVASEMATITADLAKDLASAFGHGLSDLGTQAADQVIAARERAYAALSEAPDLMPDMSPEPNLIRRHPVASAAIAVGVVAALAAAIQTNRSTDGALKQSADRLVKQARDRLEAETKAASQAVSDAADAVRLRGTEAAEAIMADLSAMLERARTSADAKAADLRDTVKKQSAKSNGPRAV